MTEQERVKAINLLNDWRRQDVTVKEMITTVLVATGQPAAGHLARFHPDVFDELFEECEAIIENPE